MARRMGLIASSRIVALSASRPQLEERRRLATSPKLSSRSPVDRHTLFREPFQHHVRVMVNSAGAFLEDSLMASNFGVLYRASEALEACDTVILHLGAWSGALYLACIHERGGGGYP